MQTRQKLREFEWEVLCHPPNSTDIAPSDFHIYRPLQTSLYEKKFTSVDECKSYISRFFEEKNRQFWKDGILALPERWETVLDKNGEYIHHIRRITIGLEE